MVIDYNALLQECTNGVHPQIMHGIIRQESSFNPYAIGVVNGRLSRQPTTHSEAIATVKMLQRNGMNYSMGLAQVNKQHMGRFGFTAENIFEPCANVKAGATIFNQCHIAAKQRFGNTPHAIGAALSCYYSGNFTTGFKRYGTDKAPYVDSVRANMLTYNNRPAKIGTPALQRAAMTTIRVNQLTPKAQTVAVAVNETVSPPAQNNVVAMTEKQQPTFLISGGMQKTERTDISQNQHLNSSLLF